MCTRNTIRGSSGAHRLSCKQHLVRSSELETVNMCHHAKFREDQSNRSRDVAIFQFLRWWPSAILDFFKSKFLPSLGYRGSKCIIRPNFMEICQTVVQLWRFNGFQNGGRPSTWILTVATVQVVSLCDVIVQNFMAIDQTVAEI